MPPLSGRLRRATAIAAATLLLGACQMAALPSLQRPVALLDGALAVTAPRGYCIDKGAGQQTDDTAVVLMGRCRGALRVPPAVLTVSVGPAGSAGAMAAGGDALTAYFTSPEGRAALSRNGRADEVQVIGAVGADDSYLLHLSDRGAGEYWRALIGLRGRLVTVSANGTQAAPLSPDAGRDLLDAALQALRKANPAANPVAKL